MNSGVVTNFGTGGIYGDRKYFVTRQPNDRTTTSPGSLGDSTKIIYLSPQFFGFDFGASYAFNYGEGEDTGCSTNPVQRLVRHAPMPSPAPAASASPRPVRNMSARRNEYQAGGPLARQPGRHRPGVHRWLCRRQRGPRADPGSGHQSRVFNNLNVYPDWRAGDRLWLHGRRAVRARRQQLLLGQHHAW